MAHEDLAREQHVEGSSDRMFGLVFAGVFLIIATAPIAAGRAPRPWAGVVAAVFALIAFVRPALLSGLNRLWLKLGLLLGKIVSPIALGILFYGVFTPLAFISRLRGKDALRLKRDEQAATYWLPREPPGPAPDSMTNQF